MAKAARETALAGPWRLMLVFALLALGIAGAGMLYYFQEREHILRIQESNLESIADMRVRQISNWRRERRADAEVILNNRSIARSIRQLFQNPEDQTIFSEILEWMSALQKNFDYRDVILLDPEGTIRFGLGDQSKSIGSHIKPLISQSAKNAVILMSELGRSPEVSYIHMDILVPCLEQSEGEGKVVALVLLRIDPRQFLYPLIETWPIASETGESLLVRQDGGNVVYLNDLRYQKNTALALRHPLTSKHLPSVQAVLGEEGVFQGRDYRGVPVLAVLRHVADSPWHVVAKMDLREVYAPIQRQGMLIAGIVAAMIAAAGATAAYVWRRQTDRFLRHHQETELDYQALMRQYQYLTHHANDAILLLDRESNILDSNQRAAALYGYDREELLHMRLGQLQPSLTNPGLRHHMRQAEELPQGYPFETIHRRRTGERFPVEALLHAIDVEGTRLYQAIIRDVSERKRAEDALQESKEMFAMVFRETPAVVMIASMADGRYLDVNKAFEEATGFSRDQVIGKNPMELGILTDGRIVRQVIHAVQERRLTRDVEIIFRDKLGHPLMGLLSAALIHVSGESCLLIVMTDITERKRSEEETRAREHRYRTMVLQAPVGIFELDLEGKCVFVNQHWSRITGYSEEDATGRQAFSMLHPDDRERILEEWKRVRVDGRQFAAKARLQTPNGDEKQVLATVMAMTNERDEMIGFVGALSEIFPAQ